MQKEWNDQVALWMQRYEKEYEKGSDYKRRFDRLSTIYENFCRVMFDSKFHKLIDIYTVDGFNYVVFISNFEHIRDSIFGFHFISKPLYVEDPDKMISVDIEINENKLEIVSIDICHYSERHGRILVQYIEEYSLANDITKIWGRMYEKTPIGLENLIRFYKKIGYDVYETKQSKCFRKTLSTEAI